MLLELLGVLTTLIALWGSWELSRLNIIKCCYLWYISNTGMIIYNICHGTWCSVLLFTFYLITTIMTHINATISSVEGK